jgi:hypothetical protein
LACGAAAVSGDGLVLSRARPAPPTPQASSPPSPPSLAVAPRLRRPVRPRPLAPSLPAVARLLVSRRWFLSSFIPTVGLVDVGAGRVWMDGESRFLSRVQATLASARFPSELSLQGALGN